MNKVKNYKLLFIFSIFLLFSIFNYSTVLAVVFGDYGRTSISSQDVTLDDWNFLDEDFLRTTGASFDGDFNLNNHFILSLDTDTSDDSGAVNLNYLNSRMSGVLGGDTYINWGNNYCQGTDTMLYSGYGFSNYYVDTSGSDNPICIAHPFDGSILDISVISDELYPLMTGSASLLPTTSVDPLSTINNQRLVKCAVCFRSGHTCYLNIGTHDCTTSFFLNKAYDGYMTGEINYSTHQSSLERHCLNRDFDASETAPAWGAIWYGSRIQNNFGLSGYNTMRYLECSICCN